jgi:pilus assembly protein CpaE
VDELGLAPVADAPVPSKPMERDASARRIATGDGLGAGPRHAGMEWEERVTAPFPAGSVRLEDGAGEIEELDRDAHVPPSRPVGGPGASEPPQAPVPERPVPTPRADSSVPAHACPIVTLASGRGGVGKTTLSVVAACVASSWGLRVGLVDLDLSFGNAFSFMGLAGPGDLAEFAQSSGDERERAIRSARKAADGLTLWGPCARPELAEVVVPQVGALLSRVSKEVDLVIVDTSSDWGDEVAVACQMADRLVLVADERAGAVASLSRAGALAVRLGVARTRIERVMNRCDRKRRDEGFLARADMGLEVARAHRVVDGGIDVSELLSAGQASELVAMDDGFSASVASWIASTLSELGALPDVPEARKAAERTGRQARRMPFGLGRKAS